MALSAEEPQVSSELMWSIVQRVQRTKNLEAKDVCSGDGKAWR